MRLPRPLAVLWQAGVRFLDDEGDMMAGYIAFSVLLAIFPFLIFCTSLVGLLIGPGETVQAVDFLFRLLPPHVAQTLEPVVIEVLGQGSRGVLTLSALIALWTASNGVEAFRVSLDRAYAVARPRPWWLRRLVAIGVVVLGVATILILGVAIVFAPLLLSLAERYLETPPPWLLGWGRYGVGLLMLLLFLQVLHRVLPAPGARPHRIWPGVLVSAALWLGGAVLFSVYLSFAPSYTVTYGTLAGVIITMLFFYLTGVVVIYGAEVNASLTSPGLAEEG